MELGLAYIRKYYNVPAYRGAHVRVGGDRNGVITSASGPYLKIRFDGFSRADPVRFHPTFEIEYLDRPWPSFGDFVMVSRRYFRFRKWEGQPRAEIKYWEAKDMAMQKCLFLGYRTLYNGEVDWSPESVTVDFVPQAHVRAALVCAGGRTNPFYAPIESLTKI